jgi:toxin HigB-1
MADGGIVEIYTRSITFSYPRFNANPLTSSRLLTSPYIDSCCATCDTLKVIKSFKHKGPQRFYETGKTTGIQAMHRSKLRAQLTVLDAAETIGDVNVEGFRLHPLKGDRKNRRPRWSITVNGNWRVTFEIENGDVFIVDYEDYHGK